MMSNVHTGYETSNVQAVLDGDLDGFIKSYFNGIWRGRYRELRTFSERFKMKRWKTK